MSVGLLLASAGIAAGEVFGTISENNRPVTREMVTIDCGSGARTARTDEYGSYRLFVGTEGSCKLTVRGLESATIRSYSSPQRYNFEIRSGAGKATLERR